MNIIYKYVQENKIEMPRLLKIVLFEIQIRNKITKKSKVITENVKI
jgi:hypothetical protein